MYSFSRKRFGWVCMIFCGVPYGPYSRKGFTISLKFKGLYNYYFSERQSSLFHGHERERDREDAMGVHKRKGGGR